MKKLLVLALACLFIIGLFACNKPTTPVTVEKEHETISETTEKVPETVPEETEETPETTEAPKTNEPVQSEDNEIPDAVYPTDINNPAKLGQWVKSSRYNVVTEKDETIYCRIVQVTTDYKEDIDNYNQTSSFLKFEALEDDNLTYVVATYEVYFPKTYSEGEYGISSYDLRDLSAVNPEGGGFQKDGQVYVGLGNTYDLKLKPDTTLHAGDTYTGKAAFTMVDGETGYVFRLRVNGEYLYISNGY